MEKQYLWGFLLEKDNERSKVIDYQHYRYSIYVSLLFFGYEHHTAKQTAEAFYLNALYSAVV